MNRIIPGTNYSVNSPLGEIIPVVLLRQASIQLDNEEIKALPNNNHTIVSAPGEGKIIIVESALIYLNSSVAYASIEATSYIRILPSGLDIADEQANSSVTQLLGTAEPNFLSINREHSIITDWGTSTPIGNLLASAQVNTPIELTVENSDTDFTGGHADNQLTVAILYYLFNTTTSKFE